MRKQVNNFVFDISLSRSEAMIEKMSKELGKEQDALRELHMKSQQFKQALAQHVK